MNRIAACMLLDFRSFPIRGRILLPILLPLFPLVILFNDSHDSNALLSPLGYMPMMLCSQLFALEEKNRLETLHATLPLTRDDIVKVKYLNLAFILAFETLPVFLLKLLFFPNNKMSYIFIAGIFLVASFTTAILYLLYFKFGSGKILIFMVPFMFIFPFIIFTLSLLKRYFALYSRLGAATSAGMAAAGVIFLYLSYLLLLKIYRTRDF